MPCCLEAKNFLVKKNNENDLKVKPMKSKCVLFNLKLELKKSHPKIMMGEQTRKGVIEIKVLELNLELN